MKLRLDQVEKVYEDFLNDYLCEEPQHRHNYVRYDGLFKLRNIQKYGLRFNLGDGESLEDSCIFVRLDKNHPEDLNLPAEYHGLRVFYEVKEKEDPFDPSGVPQDSLYDDLERELFRDGLSIGDLEAVVISEEVGEEYDVEVKEKPKILKQREDENELKEKYEAGPFLAYTKDKIFFLVDGELGEYIASIPRNPTDQQIPDYI